MVLILQLVLEVWHNYLYASEYGHAVCCLKTNSYIKKVVDNTNFFQIPPDNQFGETDYAYPDSSSKVGWSSFLTNIYLELLESHISINILLMLDSSPLLSI